MQPVSLRQLKRRCIVFNAVVTAPGAHLLVFQVRKRGHLQLAIKFKHITFLARVRVVDAGIRKAYQVMSISLLWLAASLSVLTS
ncbi:hypothetical protein D5T76_11585 [Salmonella enterica]|uniref:Uncharacterized protein n=3 Tax=Salmonella enterica TaxID=28901 RepID=A0A3R0U4I2_SALER|nr:hypothetical protein [Salmonella enterica subsp. enterica serovar Java]EAA2594500.1 hypothetical protein [Salmonella enterica subsp. enterica serovar Poona]EAM4650006.1 hypothetical protein [Salmonella enterica]EBH8950686.1 hypothetical protein [Salmonella enterica subsp. diarizonae serovar 48:i:z]EBQ9442132.1 hypothetical protein [Salmonella enterica subsp. enterica serovar Cerro]EBU6738372.1 hypothetical protein [Salmonella enterica subsp. enterica serovar Adelaide]EBU8671956.1 hypotheti